MRNKNKSSIEQATTNVIVHQDKRLQKLKQEADANRNRREADIEFLEVHW